MRDDKPFDAVEDLVSMEALSAMAAALTPDENEPSDDDERNNDNRSDAPIRPHSRDELA